MVSINIEVWREGKNSNSFIEEVKLSWEIIGVIWIEI